MAAVLVVLASGDMRAMAEPPEGAEAIYNRALAREREIRDARNRVKVSEIRTTIRLYESVVRKFPRSGYCDNALWQAANLALLAYDRSGDQDYRRTAVRLLNHLKKGYPTSSFVARAEALAKQTTAAMAAADAAPVNKPDSATASTGSDDGVASEEAPVPEGTEAAASPSSVQTSTARSDAPRGIVTIKDIKRSPLPDGVRVTIEMDGESLYRVERLENPSRVFFDLKGTRAVPTLQGATLKSGDDIVREIRLGRHPQQTTRVVMDLENVERYSVFTLYNPFRLVIDFQRSGAPVASTASRATWTPASRTDTPVPAALSSPSPSKPEVVTADVPKLETPAWAPPKVEGDAPPAPAAPPAAKEPVPMIARPKGSDPIVPSAPSANTNGQFSIARQLGLGISRIVLDAGHGGHDPGARANGLNEAELVLDVTLRLKKLLEKEPGIEVVLTRDSNVFIPLEERTAIANRVGADLFLSIHANASRNTKARGIETYFLNFASNPEAEAVAARENSASGRSMHSLPEIVKAIALNNKIDESRDFARMVQQAMVKKLSAKNAEVKDLGVKQAPFVVLIGAGMPSVLAEISFVTNRQESALLKTASYRQQIAESLFEAILRYQRSLKGGRAIASRE